MKKIIPFLTVVLLCISAAVYGNKNAEENSVIKIFDKYEGQEGVESITISPALLGLMGSGKTGDKKTQELISKISGLRILTLTNSKNSAKREALAAKLQREIFIAELRAVVEKDFAEIMKIKSSGEQVELYVRHKPDCKDCKSALLFITSTTEDVMVMYLSGVIDNSLIDAVMNGEIGISNK